MEHTCASCKRTIEIPAHAAWPQGCAYCGGTVWTSGMEFTASETFVAPTVALEPFATTLRVGTIDTAGLANGLLRQPGSPSVNPSNR